MKLFKSPSNNKKDKDKKTKKKYLPIILIASALGIIFLALIGFLFLDQVYANKFYPRTQVENLNLSGKTKEEIQSDIENRANELLKSSINFEIADKSAEKITYSDLGASYNTAEVLDKLWQIGHEYSLNSKLSVFTTLINGATFNLEPEFDQAILDSALANYSEKTNIQPENASIKVTEGIAEITPGKNGQSIDLMSLGTVVKNAVTNRTSTILISYQDQKPEVEEKDLSDALFQSQTWLNQKLNFIYGEDIYSADSKEIGLWIKYEEKDGKISAALDDEKITQYLNGIAENIDKPARARKINGSNSQVIDEGSDGISLDRKFALKQIKDTLNKKGGSDITLVTTDVPKSEKTVFDGATTGLYPGKYVEVDLSEQKLFRIEGDNIASENTVSTGKWSMPTPTGTFSILSKDPRAYSATYDLYMPYWMAFIGTQYGIHALPEWPSGYREGEAHLGHPVSHGCIRLSDDDAKAMYDWADIGIPVIVHD